MWCQRTTTPTIYQHSKNHFSSSDPTIISYNIIIQRTNSPHHANPNWRAYSTAISTNNTCFPFVAGSIYQTYDSIIVTSTLALGTDWQDTHKYHSVDRWTSQQTVHSEQHLVPWITWSSVRAVYYTRPAFAIKAQIILLASANDSNGCCFLWNQWSGSILTFGCWFGCWASVDQTFFVPILIFFFGAEKIMGGIG